MKFYKLPIIFISLLSVFAPAQDTSTILANYEEGSFLSKDKNWELTLPIWIPGFRGNFAYGDITLDGEDGTDPGDPGEPTDPPSGGGNILSRLFNSSTFLKIFLWVE